MPITLTPRATEELNGLLAERPNSALRVWVQGGGCSGLSYGMALDDQPSEDGDQEFTDQGVKIIVDAMSLRYMDGSTVDYVDDDFGGGFKIDNPNAVSGCGCGSSFKTADGEAMEGGGGCGGCGCKS